MGKGMGMGTGTSITSTLTMVPALVVGRGRNIGFSSADDCSKQFGRQLLLRLVSFAVEICYVVASRGVQDGIQGWLVGGCGNDSLMRLVYGHLPRCCFVYHLGCS